MNNNFFALCTQLGKLCVEQNVCIAMAESCTGGLVSSLITEASGSSKWFSGGAVVYSNQAKQTILHVDASLLEKQGAVSEAVALAMVKGALKQFEADIAVSITGIAGPHGGSAEKPVGMVCFALADRRSNFIEARTAHFTSGRHWIRECAASFALEWIIKQLGSEPEH